MARARYDSDRCCVRQTALKTLHVFHRLMRECDNSLLQLVRPALARWEASASLL